MIFKALFTALLLGSALYGEDIYATFDTAALQQSNLAFGVGGVIGKIHADVGTQLRKGEVIASLNNDDLRHSIEIAKAELEIAKEQFSHAKKEMERIQQVKGLISQEEYDKHALELRLKELHIRQGEAALAYKQALLDKTILRAPFGGVIALRHVEEGDGIGANAPAFVLINQFQRKLIIKFDEKYAARVRPGQSFLFCVDGSSAPQVARITKVYPSVDPRNRKATAEALVRDAALKPGLFGEGSIKAE